MKEPEKTAALRRLKSIEGHVGGIIRMTEENAYCIDLIRQIQAVQAALDKVSELVLESHMGTCLVRAVRGEDPDEREQVLGEIVDVFRARRRS